MERDWIDNGPEGADESLVVLSADILDQMKKSVFYGRPLDPAKMADQLTGIVTLVEMCAFQLGFTMDQVKEMNIAKLQLRFPEGFFTSVRANNRDTDLEMTAINT